MSNTYLNIPMPAGTGAGAAVNVSALGALKTFIWGGDCARAGVQIQISVNGGTAWATIYTITAGSPRRINFFRSATHVRTFVTNRTPPFNVNLDVGADDTAPDFDAVPIPTFGTTFGTPLNVSAYGRYMTIICGGQLGGAIIEIEASEDGTSYATIAVFQNEVMRLAQVECVAKFLRSKVTGRKSVVPFSGTVSVGFSVFDTGTIPAPPPPPTFTPKSYLPERWAVVNVPGTDGPIDMEPGVSMVSNDFMVDRDGSVIGLVLRFDDAPAGGAATAEVLVNGVGTGFTVTVSSPSKEEFAVVAIDTFPFVAGDLISAQLTTVGILPADELTAELTIEVSSS